MYQQIEEANLQLMQILKLDPSAGWKLDIDRMVYTRPYEESTEDASVTG